MLFSNCKSTKSVHSVSISNENHPLAKVAGSDLNGNWEVQSLWGLQNIKTTGSFIKIDFANKTFTGNTGCNDIAGSFSLKGNLFLIDKNMQVGKNACPSHLDKKFTNMLMKINKYDISNNILELSQDNIVLMTFKKESS